MFIAPRSLALGLRNAADAMPQDLIEESGLFRRAIVPRAARAAALRADASTIDRFVVQVMSLDLLTTVILQRVYVGVSVTLATQFVAVLVLLLWGRLQFSAARLALYWVFWGGALLMQFVSGNTYSPTSLLLGVVCYLPFLAVVPASEATYFEVIKAYQRITMVVSGIVFLDIVLQLAGLGMPDMDRVIPPSLTAPTMNYIQPLTYGSGMIKPNAFFMLEASYTSQFIAIGLVIELAFFRRWAWLATFAAALMATFSGTGLMLLLLTLPIVGRRYWRSMLLYALILLPLLGGAALATGWWEIVSQRIESFDAKKSSANGRFITPFTTIYEVMAAGDEHDIIYGFGAGKTAFTEVVPGILSVEYNAIAKTFLEYGVIILVVFLLFSTYFLFWTGVPFVIAFAAALEYHLMGGHLLLPPILNYCYVLTSGWAITRRASDGSVRF